MAKKKSILIGLGAAGGLLVICLGICGGIAYVVYSAVKGPAESANQFLALLGEGKTKEAYASTAALFRERQSEADFAAVVKTLALDDYASASWSNVSITGSQATLTGTVTTRQGGAIPLTMKLVKEGESWKVLGFEGPQGGGSVKNGKRQLPPTKELQQLTTATLLDFNQAIQAGDFTAFHGKIATIWKQQTTPAALRKVFQTFIDQKINLAGIKDVEPIFDKPPALNEQGVLSLSGYFPTQPSRVFFELEFLYEHPNWKLITIKVNVK